jgi:hypothetical protein
MGHVQGVIDECTRLHRHQVTQCPIYRGTQEVMEEAEVKKRGLTTLQLPARKCVPVAKAIFQQSCIHNQVTYNKLCPVS